MNGFGARYPGKFEPENIHVAFHLCPNEPNTFVLKIDVTAPGEQVIEMQHALVAALHVAGLKV
jgi:hypothetical protein